MNLNWSIIVSIRIFHLRDKIKQKILKVLIPRCVIRGHMTLVSPVSNFFIWGSFTKPNLSLMPWPPPPAFTAYCDHTQLEVVNHRIWQFLPFSTIFTTIFCVENWLFCTVYFYFSLKMESQFSDETEPLIMTTLQTFSPEVDFCPSCGALLPGLLDINSQ